MQVRRFRFTAILGSSFLAFATLLLTVSDAVSAPQPDPEVLVLKGARIHTMTERGTITGTIIVRDGKITAIGADLPSPSNAREIALDGTTIVPGLIDSRSSLWLTRAALNETSTRAALTILDGVDPFLEDWREVARQGVTAVFVQPSAGSSLGGLGAVLRVAPAQSVETLVIRSDAALQASLGITGSTSRERFGQFQKLQRALKSVKDGKTPEAEEEKEEEASPDEGQRGGFPRGRTGRGGARGAGGRGSAPTQPDRTKELLEKVIAREIPLRIEVHHPDTLMWALSLVTEFDIRLVLEGVSVPGGALPSLAELRTPVVLGPVWETGKAPSYREARADDWLSRVTESTGPWALGTFASEGRSSRLLRLHAAAAIAAGLEPDAVLRALTIDAARILGVDDTIGSIAPGMSADLAVFAGDPLDPSVSARLVLSQGRIVFEGNRGSRASTSRATIDLPESLPASYALRSDHVLRDGELEAATLWVRDGKIAGLGNSIEIPEGTPVFELGKGVITPGLVAAHATLGLSASSNDGTESDASQLRAIDVADPSCDAAQALLEGGFITVALPPASTTTSAGVVGALRLGAPETTWHPSIAGQFVMAASARTDQRFPASLFGQGELLGDLFAGRAPATRLYLPPSAQEALVAERKRNVRAVVSGERVALIQAQTHAEISAALRLIAEHELRASLVGPTEIIDHLESLRALGVGLIAGPISGTDFDRVADQLAAASTMGIPIAFAGESPEEIRATAALAVEAGMPRDRALLGLTRTAAQLTGMPRGTASLSIGQPADLVIWNASPLNLSARPVRVIVGGNVVDPQQ